MVKVVEARGEAPLPVEVIERSIVELAEGNNSQQSRRPGAHLSQAESE